MFFRCTISNTALAPSPSWKPNRAPRTWRTYRCPLTLWRPQTSRPAASSWPIHQRNVRCCPKAIPRGVTLAGLTAGCVYRARVTLPRYPKASTLDRAISTCHWRHHSPYSTRPLPPTVWMSTDHPTGSPSPTFAGSLWSRAARRHPAEMPRIGRRRRRDREELHLEMLDRDMALQQKLRTWIRTSKLMNKCRRSSAALFRMI